MRSLSHELHSSRLELVGLVPALSGLCEEITRKYKIDIHFTERDVPVELRKDVGLCLFRVAQEALINVVKHSGASCVQVDLGGGPNTVSLRISDEGKGFDSALKSDGAGIGLISLRERIRLVGGTLTVHAELNRGTVILAEVPVSAAVDAEPRSDIRRRGTAVMSRPRVLLADDHRMLADALKKVLEPRCEVVGTVVDGRALLEAAAKLNPDIVVLDIAMPRLNGLDAGRQLKARMPNVKLIFMTQHEDPYLVGEAFRAGGSAFLLKEAAASELIDALDAVLRGGTYVTPSAAEGQTSISLRDPKDRDHAPELSPRQREVVQLLAEGRSMKEVADELKISIRTVAGHKYAVMEHLQLEEPTPTWSSTPSSTRSSPSNRVSKDPATPSELPIDSPLDRAQCECEGRRCAGASKSPGPVKQH